MADHIVSLPQGGAVPLSDLPLSPAIADALSNNLSIPTLFSAQAAVLAHFHASPDRDIVLCAPTGSGKTLCYALPILSALSTRIVPRLRAVIVAPTRDLAAQIHAVISALSASTSLKVSLAAGASSLKREAASLAATDILVATPGRLVDHVRVTPHFSLADVRYLVLDESDRLLNDAYYSWIDVVVPACGRQHIADGDNDDFRQPLGLSALAIHPLRRAREHIRRSPLIFLASATQTRDPKRLTLLDLKRPVQFVAAGTEEPAAAAEGSGADSEKHARLIDDDVVHILPETLQETAYVLKDLEDKPAALAALLGLHAPSSAAAGSGGAVVALPTAGSKLIFANSVDSAHRLARLLELLVHNARADVSVLEMSGDLSPSRRAAVIAAINASAAGATTIIVSSDLLTRGMDIAGVDAVINYDAPVHVNTYVHRVGRTARAGRNGMAISLVLARQARHFKALVRSIERGEAKVRFTSVSGEGKCSPELISFVQGGLSALKRLLRREQLGLLSTERPVPSFTLRDLQPKEVVKPALKQNAHVHPDRMAAIDKARQNLPQVVAETATVEGEEDDFSRLLRSQVASNFLSTAS